MNTVLAPRWSYLPDVPRLLGLALAYALVANIFLAYFSANGIVSIVWPSSGIALAALLIGGKKYWPGVFAGALAANVLAGSSVPVSAAIATGNTLEPLLGIWLLNRAGHFDPKLRYSQDYFRLIFAGLVSPGISAVCGTTTLLLVGFLTTQTYAQNLLHWWMGDALGIIFVAPLILVWLQAQRDWFRKERAVEMAVFFAAAFFAGQAIYLEWFRATLGPIVQGYWMFLFVIWGAVRFGRHGALLVITVTAVQALTGAALGKGFFGHDIAFTQLTNFWFYMAILSVIGMTLATIFGERKQLEKRLTRQIRHLDVVERISRRTIVSANTEEMLEGALDEVLTAFDADRAWFLYPCDPHAAAWHVPMERTRPAWPGVFALGTEMPMTPEIADVMRQMLAAKGVVQHGPLAAQPVPGSVARQFAVKSMLQIVLRPKVGHPWLMGVHHCAQARLHDTDDLLTFAEIAQHVADGLSSLISLQHLHENEERFRSLFQHAPIGLFHSLPEGRFLLVNPVLAGMLGYASPAEMMDAVSDMATDLYVDPQQRAEIIASILKQDGWMHAESDFRRKNGEVITVKLTGRKVRNTDGSIAYLESFIEDITEKKLSEELIWKQANFDHLTKLPNRRLFHDRLAQEVMKTQRNGLTLALLFIDLDRFKEVNDILGHEAGDMLLVEAARRIAGCVRQTDTVARIGGDEFTVILPELADPGSVHQVAQNIINALCDTFHLNGETAYISASIGITFYPGDATEIENLLRNADQAMYVAKEDGRNRYSLFTPSLQAAAQTRQRLVRDLRGALAGEQFAVHFQPIVDLATGRIHKAEALLRWHHPERGLVGPGEFIPIAEDTGLIVDIGRWVFQESARWIQRWQDLCPEGFQVSVNKSPVQFLAEGENHDDWFAFLHELGLTGRNIAIEITEGLLLNAEVGVTDKLLKFRDAGIQVAIDDFGTGYSSLSYLKKFDIDYLKIDQSFIRNLESDAADMALSEAIVVMAHKLGLKVVAEGVETEAQRKLLSDVGCDYAQGYLFSRPVTPEAFEQLFLRR